VESDSVHRVVAEAVAPAYYEEAIKAPAAIRAQSQAAAAVATAAAAALVATGAFGDISAERAWVQVLGSIALAGWSVTALLYVRAVSGAVELPERGSVDTGERFVETILDHSRAERTALERRAKAAFIAACLAVGATLAAVIGGIATAQPKATSRGQLVLNEGGRTALTGLCAKDSRLSGVVDTDTLSEQTVVLRIPGCPSATEDVQISRNLIAGFVEAR
jgi:hypothetical protein